MNTDDNNITTMHSTVERYMLDNTTKWTSVKAISDAVQKLATNNAFIAEKRAVQEQALEGETDLKKSLKRNLVDNVHIIADQLYALSQRTADVVLAGQTHVSVSGLRSLVDDLLIEKAEEIRDIATAKKTDLLDYSIVDADIAALDDAIKAFQTDKNAPAVARAKRVGATRTIPGAIHDNQKLLADQLDKMLSAFRLKDPPFYAGYHSARVVVDRRAHRKQEPPTPPTPPPA